MANLPDTFRRNRGLFSEFFRDLDDLFTDRPSAFLPRVMDMTPGRFDYDLEDDDDQFVATFEVPGFKPDEIKIDVSGNMLTVCAECEHEKEEGKHAFSRRVGRIQRTLMLPPNADTEHVKAHYENGILEVCVPKTESSKRRSIEIQEGRASRSRKQIDSKTKTTAKNANPRH